MIFTTILLKRSLMLNYWITDKWKDLFDFSNYSKDSKFFDDTNKNVIGKMKDEYGGNIIDEFIALKSKIYSIKK